MLKQGYSKESQFDAIAKLSVRCSLRSMPICWLHFQQFENHNAQHFEVSILRAALSASVAEHFRDEETKNAAGMASNDIDRYMNADTAWFVRHSAISVGAAALIFPAVGQEAQTTNALSAIEASSHCFKDYPVREVVELFWRELQLDCMRLLEQSDFSQDRLWRADARVQNYPETLECKEISSARFSRSNCSDFWLS